MKSRFMSPDQNDYQRQKNFDDALAKIPTIDLSGYGPTIEEFPLKGSAKCQKRTFAEGLMGERTRGAPFR